MHGTNEITPEPKTKTEQQITDSKKSKTETGNGRTNGRRTIEGEQWNREILKQRADRHRAAIAVEQNESVNY